MKEEELLEYLFGFKFILDLKDNREEKEHVALQRDAEEYFCTLEALSQQSYLESPYYQYIIGKLSRTDRLRNLLQKRRQVRAEKRL